MSRQDEFFAVVAARRLVRPAVRAIVHSDRGFLVQRPTDEPGSNYAFIGGEYEFGDTFEERLRNEFEEETSACVVSVDYRFVVENRFMVKERLVQTLEHYFEVSLDRMDVVSREAHLEQVWLSEDAFAAADVRPTVVRNALLLQDWRSLRRLSVSI
jgi:8-oxo-dGTP pyrophosphatase MutT (NUDIX family)